MTANTTAPAVRVDRLTKRFGDRAAVDELSFELPRGVVAGFIGPNGAGKTTTMAMLLGLVAPTSGTGTVLGHPLDRPAAFLPRVGALIEGPAMYPGLTATENLRVLAAMGRRDPARIPAVLDLVGLGERADDRFREFSMGMKQRLGIAGALLGDPELLILDEPTNGLDPVGMREIRDLIATIATQHRTVLVSSHLLSEIEQVCDWLVVIEHGAGVFAGPAVEFAGGAAATLAVAPEHVADIELLGRLLAAEGHEVDVVDGHVLLPLDDADPLALGAAVNRLAAEHGLVVAELAPRRANLQDRYLSLVEGGIR
jgi:ABC-2 type transport system ATP-binding protein